MTRKVENFTEGDPEKDRRWRNSGRSAGELPADRRGEAGAYRGIDCHIKIPSGLDYFKEIAVMNDFVEKIKNGAISAQKKYGVLASLTIAQACLGLV